MQTTWRGHTIKVQGNWVGRYLFLAPEYELWLDDELLDKNGGPRLRPRLEAIIEEDPEDDSADPQRFHIEADILSIIGMRPGCDLIVDGEVINSDTVFVDNKLNPILLLFILGASLWMLYVGPDILRSYLQ